VILVTNRERLEKPHLVYLDVLKRGKATQFAPVLLNLFDRASFVENAHAFL
jgi:hypothetical protein